MIKVTEHTNGSYTLEIDTPERITISEIAIGFAISKEEAIHAVIVRGMDSIGKQLKDEAAKVTAKRKAAEPEPDIHLRESDHMKLVKPSVVFEDLSKGEGN